MPPICLFDVNETLLDLSALDPHFARIFGDGKRVRTEWFQQLLQSAFLSTLLGPYADFTVLGDAALEMTAARHAITLTEAQKQDILSAMRRLPPHPDAADALSRLQAGGARLVALTNSTEEVGRAQLDFAQLSRFFEHILSADSVQRLKPAPEPYQMVAQVMQVPIGETWLIAAHAWDTTGAHKAGCRTAFVARPQQPLDPRAPQPEIVSPDLSTIAERILDLSRTATV